MGGTKIAAAVVDSDGNVRVRGRIETPETLEPSVLVDAIEKVSLQVLDEGKVSLSAMKGVGMSSAGIVNSREGIVNFSPNIPALRRTPLRDMLSERFGKPVGLGNDASLAALAEWQFGLNRSVDNLVYVTLSTGIGGGIIAGGKLYEGACGGAGEVGHMVIDVNGPACPCGRKGCWEALASGSALANRAAARVAAGDNSLLRELCGGEPEKIDAYIVALAAGQGDALAQEMIATTAYYVGVGLANLINIFNPSLILIGGGLAKIGDSLLGPAAKVAKELAYVADACEMDIRPALLGDDSPLLGAAALVMGPFAHEVPQESA